MKRVFTDQDGNILGSHDLDIGITAAVYTAQGHEGVREFLLSDEVVPSASRDRETGVFSFARLDPDFIANYVEPVPASITGTQAKLTLLEAGKYQEVVDTISAIPDPNLQMAAELKFNAATWYRNEPLFNDIGEAVGLTPEQIDDLFRAASKK